MKNFSFTTLLCVASLVLIVTGCNRQETLVAPEIHYGVAICADCGMIINDSHFAAALAWRDSSDGTTQTAVFDDIGCLLAWQHHHAGAQIAAAWVKDMHTGAWLDAASAVYVKNPHLQTPMGGGVVAGSTKSDFPELSGQLSFLAWTDLLNAGTQQADAASQANRNQN
jgi:nitrous oxide reductase accessory protein NosL